MTKPWRYKLDAPFTYSHALLQGVVFSCEWATIENGTISIREGYAWDGCSPAWCIPGTDIWLGTPDGTLRADGRPETFEASLVHDVLCQFSKQVPMTKSRVSDLFKAMLIENGFPKWRASLYRSAVHAFGPQKWGL